MFNWAHSLSPDKKKIGFIERKVELKEFKTPKMSIFSLDVDIVYIILLNEVLHQK